MSFLHYTCSASVYVPYMMSVRGPRGSSFAAGSHQE